MRLRVISVMRLIFSWALCVATAQAVQRYGAVESGALVPRYFLDPAFPLAKRADSCQEDTHSCKYFFFEFCLLHMEIW